MRNKLASWIIVFSSICLFTYSCTNNQAINDEIIINENNIDKSLREYMDYFRLDNGLKKKRIVGDITYNLEYIPVNYSLVKQIDLNRISLANLKSTLKEKKTIQEYILKICLNDKGKDILKYNIQSLQEEQARLGYISFDFQNDITLIDGSDSLKCVMYHFERTYGLSSNCTLILGFPNNKKNESTSKQLILNDKAFGGGIIKMKIDIQDIKKIPELRFNT